MLRESLADACSGAGGAQAPALAAHCDARTSLGGRICPLLHAPGTPVLSPTPQQSHRGPSSGDSQPCIGGFAGG